MYLIIQSNECCGCSSPVFVGLFTDEQEAKAAIEGADAAKVVIREVQEGVSLVGWFND